MEPKCKIKHLVISGGGETGFVIYGALKETYRQGLWNYEDTISMHCTSIGSMIALSVLLSKKIGWDILDDYWHLRPWNTVFDFSFDNIMNSIEKTGLLDMKTVEKMFHPCLHACELSTDITLQEFYEEIGIELHVYSCNIDKMELVDISYKTHPTWKLLEAVYCSSALPILFSPYKKDGFFYFDGGILANYPLMQCIEQGIDPDEIFGIQKMPNEYEMKNKEFTSITDYLFTIFAKLLEKLDAKCPSIKYEICIPGGLSNMYDIYKMAYEPAARRNAIDKGIEIGREYMEKMKSASSSLESMKLIERKQHKLCLIIVK